MLRAVLLWEYALLAVLTAGLGVVVGSLLATGLMQWRLDMSPAGLWWTGVLTAVMVSAVSLGMGARYLLSQMRINPATLLRTGG